MAVPGSERSPRYAGPTRLVDDRRERGAKDELARVSLPCAPKLPGMRAKPNGGGVPARKFMSFMPETVEAIPTRKRAAAVRLDGKVDGEARAYDYQGSQSVERRRCSPALPPDASRPDGGSPVRDVQLSHRVLKVCCYPSERIADVILRREDKSEVVGDGMKDIPYRMGLSRTDY